MSSVWQSYLPHHVAIDLIESEGRNLIGREQRFDAVALFADVSGFTAISEALASQGRSGAEELTVILNQYFEPMIALIQSYGGIIGKFGGDAMTVLFPYAETNRSVIVSRAVHCALEMQQRMSQYESIATRGGTFSLAMKAGLAGGPLLCTTVGDPTTRLEYIIAGTVLDRCADAEHRATRGEVVVHNDLLQWAHNLVAAEPRGSFSLIAEVNEPVLPAPLPPPVPFPPECLTVASSFLHPTIAQRLLDEQTSFVNEHRQVTVLFIGFQGPDYDGAPDAGAALQAYFAEVVRVIHRFDGYLNKIDMGDKGSKYIVLFGAPVAHEDDTERAMYCALELRALSDDSTRIGINTGFVYCGQVGSSLRQEYTAMGDAVNVSARLMQAAAPGEILVSAATRRAGQTPFAWNAPAALQVKGKSAEITVYSLLGTLDQPASNLHEIQYTLPMVGREKELKLASDLLALTRIGQGQILGITGEGGLGKTRLATEIATMADELGFMPVGGECVSHGTTTSYLVWRGILRGALGLDGAASPDDQISRLETALTAMGGDALPRLPLLGTALNLSIPDNELTASLDAKLRKASLESLIVELIRWRARQAPILVIVEDTQWIDPLSHDLLELVARNIVDIQLLLLVLYRAPESEYHRPRVSRFAHFQEIYLKEFTRGESEALIQLKLAQLFGAAGPTPPSLTERVIERSQGNPFFIDEIINYLHDRQIDPSDPLALDSLDLPASLHSLIISRIDQVEEGAKTSLKVASVLGRSFRASWLWGVYPSLGAPERVRKQLEHLRSLDLTLLDRPEPHLEYLFKHVVTREVAYESLAVATRAMLHEQAGEYIERSYPDLLESYLDLLAYHYGSSRNTDKQRTYFRRAGESARKAYANEAAIQYYQQLLPLLPREERCDILLELGTVLQLIGRWGDAESRYREALEIAEQTENVEWTARCCRAIGVMKRSRGSFPEAMAWLSRAADYFSLLNDETSCNDALIEIGIIHWSQGDYIPALVQFEQSLKIAARLGDRHGIYRALVNTGNVYGTQGDNDTALEHFERSHQLATDLGDRPGIAVAVGNIANIYSLKGDYGAALAYYFKRLQIAVELGHRQGVSISVGNMGNVYLQQGEYDSAFTCLAKNLQLAMELGDLVGVSIALWSIAEVDFYQKRYDRAGTLIELAIDLGRALDVPYDLCDFLLTKADLLHTTAALESSWTVNQEALEMARESENDAAQFRAEILSIRLAVKRGRRSVSQAVKALELLLERWQGREQQAAIHFESWRINAQRHDHKGKATSLYRTLYAECPNILYRRRYEKLTGARLPDPAPLPPLPAIVSRDSVDIAVLIAQAQTILAGTRRASQLA